MVLVAHFLSSLSMTNALTTIDGNSKLKDSSPYGTSSEPSPPPLTSLSPSSPSSSPSSPSSPSSSNAPKAPSPLPSISSRRPRPSTSLPAVRLMALPKPGVAFDIRLPYANPARLYLAMEGYFDGTSQVRLGVELNHLPFVRIEAVPNPCITLRPSPIQLSHLKFIVSGFSIPLSSNNEQRPVLEINHRYTLFASIVDSKQRAALASLIDEIRTKQKSKTDSINLQNLSKLKQLPPLDVRRPNIDQLKSSLKDFAIPNLERRDEKNDNGNGEKDVLDSKWPPVTVKGERYPPNDVNHAAIAGRSETRGAISILGQVRTGQDGKRILVPEAEEGTLRAREVSNAINDLLDENPLLIFGRRMLMKFRPKQQLQQPR